MALATLTRREQTICTLVAEGYRWQEIGQRLGLADATARMIFRRTLARIREAVSPPAHIA